ncbi:MAG TPA: hypothetical protein VM573_10205 [Actinomycetota bacterium]|jgi:ABC-type sugar transport system substrate-binding protein|nr:hypothetical protein [Actinomycetota bacterium]
MKRIAAGAVLLFVLALAAPAAAQARDPFIPLISPQSESAAGDGATTGEAAETDPVAPPVSGTGVPDTGGDPSAGLAVAYVLIAAGAGALVLARTSRAA